MTAIKTQLQHRLIDEVCTAIATINNGEEFGLSFDNDGFKLVSIMNCGGYSILFDRTNDRLIVVWAVKIKTNILGQLEGSWGNGYYFDIDSAEQTTRLRYQVEQVVELFTKKALGV